MRRIDFQANYCYNNNNNANSNSSNKKVTYTNGSLSLDCQEHSINLYNKEIQLINSNQQQPQQYLKSPSSNILTPGRKSASPTFFHYSSTNNERMNHFQFNTNHINHSIADSNTNTNNIPSSTLRHDFYTPLSSTSSLFTQPTVNSSIFNANNFYHNELKIPTTPTRSKSLSPSLRSVIQPPRIRHKNLSSCNNNKNYIATAAFNNNNNNNENKISNSALKAITNSDFTTSNISQSTYLDITNPNTTDNNNNKNSKVEEHYFEPIKLKSFSPPSVLKKENQTNLNLDSNSDSSIKIDIDDDNNNNIKKDIISCTISNEAKLIKLPMCVRMLNLKNFPPNQGPNTKRPHSVCLLQKLKNNTNNNTASIDVLQKAMNHIINNKIKNLIEECKQEFINPAMQNISFNTCNINQETNSSGDYFNLILNSIEQAHKNLKDNISYNEVNTKNNNSAEELDHRNQSPTQSLVNSRSSSPLTSSKRKHIDYLINDQDTNNSYEMQISKKPLLTPTVYNEINSNTLFVLGKNLNELFLNENTNGAKNGTNIYSQLPNIFKYEADNEDRLWLCENSIIERKNYKTYIFRLSDILNLNFNSNKLKQFKLPEFILCKFRTNLKQHLNNNNSNVLI